MRTTGSLALLLSISIVSLAAADYESEVLQDNPFAYYPL